MLSEDTSPQLVEDEAGKLLECISIDNISRSLIYDLSEAQQVAHGGTVIYQPAKLVKEFQVISMNDEVLQELSQEIKANPTLIYNRANKPTLGERKLMSCCLIRVRQLINYSLLLKILWLIMAAYCQAQFNLIPRRNT